MKKSLYNRLHQNKGMIDIIKLHDPLITMVNNVIEKLILKKYTILLEEIISNNDKVDIPVIEYNQFLESIPIYSKEDALAMTKLIHKLNLDLISFKQSQYKKGDKAQQIKGYQHLYLFLGPIDKILLN